MGFHLNKIMNIGTKIIDLRKAKNWSQADLAKELSVSRIIVGKYERNEASPSIDIAKKIADAFDISLDYLVGEGVNSRYSTKTIKLIEDIEMLEPAVKDKLYFLANAIIRDAKTRQAYS